MKLTFRSTYSSAAGTYPAGLVTDEVPFPLAVTLFGAGAVVPTDPADLPRLEKALAETLKPSPPTDEAAAETGTSPAVQEAGGRRRGA